MSLLGRFRTIAVLAIVVVVTPGRSSHAEPLPCVFVCTGDCDANAGVTVNELVRGVAIALERAPIDDCAVLDSDANGAVTVDELLGAVGNLLQGCSNAQPLSRPPAALIRNPSWDFVSEADDPFLDARPADWFCDPSGVGFEVLDTFPSLQVDTAFCNYLTVRQAIREPVRHGDTLYISLWHFQLTIPSGAMVHMAVAANGCTLWEARRRLPTTAEFLEESFPAPFPMPEGTQVYFHVRNHGANTYHLLEVSVGGSVAQP